MLPIITIGATMPTTSTWRTVPTIISSGSAVSPCGPATRVASSAPTGSSSPGQGWALRRAISSRAMS